MRFRLSIDYLMEAESLPDAEAAFTRVEMAAHDALGDAIRADDETGALSHGTLTPVDRPAFDALAAEDLGPGISSARFRAELPPHEPDS